MKSFLKIHLEFIRMVLNAKCVCHNTPHTHTHTHVPENSKTLNTNIPYTIMMPDQVCHLQTSATQHDSLLVHSVKRSIYLSLWLLLNEHWNIATNDINGIMKRQSRPNTIEHIHITNKHKRIPDCACEQWQQTANKKCLIILTKNVLYVHRIESHCPILA